jgi:hypothetical protein
MPAVVKEWRLVGRILYLYRDPEVWVLTTQHDGFREEEGRKLNAISVEVFGCYRKDGKHYRRWKAFLWHERTYGREYEDRNYGFLLISPYTETKRSISWNEEPIEFSVSSPE